MVEAGGCAFGSKEARERNPPDAPSREVLPYGPLTGPFGLDGEEVCEPGLDRRRVGEVVSEAVMGEDRRARLRDQRRLGEERHAWWTAFYVPQVWRPCRFYRPALMLPHFDPGDLAGR